MISFSPLKNTVVYWSYEGDPVHEKIIIQNFDRYTTEKKLFNGMFFHSCNSHLSIQVQSFYLVRQHTCTFPFHSDLLTLEANYPKPSLCFYTSYLTYEVCLYNFKYILSQTILFWLSSCTLKLKL